MAVAWEGSKAHSRASGGVNIRDVAPPTHAKMVKVVRNISDNLRIHVS